MGTLVVPSVGGIRHSPKEYTGPEHVARGVDGLGRAPVTLDAER